jgi:hypothetical protein
LKNLSKLFHKRYKQQHTHSTILRFYFYYSVPSDVNVASLCINEYLQTILDLLCSEQIARTSKMNKKRQTSHNLMERNTSIIFLKNTCITWFTSILRVREKRVSICVLFVDGWEWFVSCQDFFFFFCIVIAFAIST